MRVFNIRDAVEDHVEGFGGALKALHVVQDPDFLCGMRTVGPGTRIPRPNGPPSPYRHMLFTVKGSGTVSNGEYYEKVTAGTFVLFEAGERPAYQTYDEELVVLEVAWSPSRAKTQAMPQVPQTIMQRVAAGNPAPAPRSAGVYHEV